jgi:large subunit ribosomal protein L29
MAIIKKKQFKELTTADVKKRLAELRLDLAKDRSQIAVGGSPTNPGKTREKRRTIAKLLTLMSSKKREVGKTA